MHWKSFQYMFGFIHLSSDITSTKITSDMADITKWGNLMTSSSCTHRSCPPPWIPLVVGTVTDTQGCGLVSVKIKQKGHTFTTFTDVIYLFEKIASIFIKVLIPKEGGILNFTIYVPFPYGCHTPILLNVAHHTGMKFLKSKQNSLIMKNDITYNRTQNRRFTRPMP